MPFTVYILESELDHTLYVGHTSNIEERILRHNQGRSAYTKAKRPWKLIHQESFATRALAMQREHALKALHRSDLLRDLGKSSG